MTFREWFTLFMENHHIGIMIVTFGATFIRYPINLLLSKDEALPPYNEDDFNNLKQLKLLFVWWKAKGDNRIMKHVANILFVAGPASILFLIFIGMIAAVG